MMQSCFGHHFMLVLEKQEKFDGHQQFFAIVQLIGTRKQAENFAYRLCLSTAFWSDFYVKTFQIRTKRPQKETDLGGHSKVHTRGSKLGYHEL